MASGDGKGYFEASEKSRFPASERVCDLSKGGKKRLRGESIKNARAGGFAGWFSTPRFGFTNPTLRFLTGWQIEYTL